MRMASASRCSRARDVARSRGVGRAAPHPSDDARTRAARILKVLAVTSRPPFCQVDPSPAEARKWLVGSRQQISLQEIAAELDDRFALLDGLDAFGHGDDRQVPAQRGHGSNEAPFRGMAIDASYERAVEFHELRLDGRKAREPGVPSPEIVDRNPEAQAAKVGDSASRILHLIERRAL